MSTSMLRMMVRHPTQSFTPVKLVVEMMRMPVVTAIAMEVFCVCSSLMISSRLKQQENPRISRIIHCQADSGDTPMKGYSHAVVHSRNRLIWLQIAQGELVGSPRSSTATMPKRMLGARRSAYSEEAHSMVMEPPMMAPKMMRQKQPCLPANDSHTIAKIIPPEAFHPQVRQKHSPTDVSMAASLRRSSCGLVGRKGMSRFLRRMKSRLQMKVTSMAAKTNWMGVTPSWLATDRLMHSRMGPSRSSDIGENSISGSSANSLYSYSWVSGFSSIFTSLSSRRFRRYANLRSTALWNRAKTLLLGYQALGFERTCGCVRFPWKAPWKVRVSSQKELPALPEFFMLTNIRQHPPPHHCFR